MRALDLTHADLVARAFREKYEHLAPMHDWHTDRGCWEDVPVEERALMVHAFDDLIGEGIIDPGPVLTNERVWVGPGLERAAILLVFAISTLVLISAIVATSFAPLVLPALVCGWVTYVLIRGAT